MAPGRCSICGSTAVDRKYFDLGVDLDSAPGFNYTVYICSRCILEIIELAKHFGVYIEPVTATDQHFNMEEAVADISDKIERVRSDLRDINSTLGHDQSSSGIPIIQTEQDDTESDGSERETSNSDSGSSASKGPASVPSFEELLKIGKSRK